MAQEYIIPPWLTQADPVQSYAHGLQIGSQIGTEQARQQMAQEQLLRETQKDLVDQEIEKGKFHLASDQAARNYADQAKFTTLVQGGMDPAQAMLQVPGIAKQTSELVRAANEGKITEYQKQEIDYRNRALNQRLQGKEYGDIQTVDLGDGIRAAFRPGSPGLHIIQPSANKGITPNAAATLLGKIPQIDAMTGTTDTTNSLASKLAPSLLDIITKGTTGKLPAPKSTGSPFKILSIRQKQAQQVIPIPDSGMPDGGSDNEDDTE